MPRMPQNEGPLDEEYRELMKLAGEDGCLCGIEACPGHEVIDGKVLIDSHPLGPIVITLHKNKAEDKS
jgi:hypothetical protein